MGREQRVSPSGQVEQSTLLLSAYLSSFSIVSLMTFDFWVSNQPTRLTPCFSGLFPIFAQGRAWNKLSAYSGFPVIKSWPRVGHWFGGGATGSVLAEHLQHPH